MTAKNRSYLLKLLGTYVQGILVLWLIVFVVGIWDHRLPDVPTLIIAALAGIFLNWMSNKRPKK